MYTSMQSVSSVICNAGKLEGELKEGSFHQFAFDVVPYVPWAQ